MQRSSHDFVPIFHLRMRRDMDKILKIVYNISLEVMNNWKQLPER